MTERERRLEEALTEIARHDLGPFSLGKDQPARDYNTIIKLARIAKQALCGSSGVDSDTLMTLTREGQGIGPKEHGQISVTESELVSRGPTDQGREGFPASESEDPDGTRDSRCNSDLLPTPAPAPSEEEIEGLVEECYSRMEQCILSPALAMRELRAFATDLLARRGR